MAAVASLNDENEIELTCPICFEDYQLDDTERLPKLLLCLHTFCVKCLFILLKPDRTLTCSICRAEHQIHSIYNLINNDHIIHILRKGREKTDREYAIKLAQETPDYSLNAGNYASSSEDENELCLYESISSSDEEPSRRLIADPFLLLIPYIQRKQERLRLEQQQRLRQEQQEQQRQKQVQQLQQQRQQQEQQRLRQEQQEQQRQKQVQQLQQQRQQQEQQRLRQEQQEQQRQRQVQQQRLQQRQQQEQQRLRQEQLEQQRQKQVQQRRLQQLQQQRQQQEQQRRQQQQQHNISARLSVYYDDSSSDDDSLPIENFSQLRIDGGGLVQQVQPQQNQQYSTTASQNSQEHDRKVFVGYLDHDTTKSQIISCLGRFGKIDNVTLKQSFAFVEFAYPNSARRAIGEHCINDRCVKVKSYEPRGFKIFAGSVTELSLEDLWSYFGNFGSVKDIHCPSNHFCFVTYEQESEMKEALRNPNPEVFGSTLRIRKFIKQLWSHR